MHSVWNCSAGYHSEFIGFGLEDSPAALLDLRRAVSQTMKELTYLLLHFGLGAQAGIRCHFLPYPIPDGLICIEVGAVSGQRVPAEDSSPMWPDRCG